MRLSSTTRPEWADAKNITRIFGIGKSTLYRLEAEGKIRSSSLREPGKLRGKNLFSCDSVASYIEKCSKAIKAEVISTSQTALPTNLL